MNVARGVAGFIVVTAALMLASEPASVAMSTPKSEIPVAEARAQVLAAVKPLGAETVFLLDARERILAEEIAAPHAIPPWDN